MAELVLALNKLGKVDTAFICICAGIVVAIVAIYFLIPVFKKAQYQQQIESLRAREAQIKAARASSADQDEQQNEIVDAVVPVDETVDNDSHQDVVDDNEDVAK